MTEAIQGQALSPASPAAGIGKSASVNELREVAQDFEAVFLAQVLANINRGFGSDSLLGGDGDQTVFRDMFNEEMAKLISRSGGVGVADAVLKEMLKLQEVA